MPAKDKNADSTPGAGAGTLTIRRKPGKHGAIVAKAQARRRQSRAGVRQGDHDFFESNPMPMWVRNVETNGFLAVNDAVVRLYGYSREEFLGMTGFDLRVPEQHARYREFVLRRKASQITINRWRHRRKDGAFIDVEVTARGFTYRGRPARLAVINDITERVRAEENVASERNLMRSVLDALLDHVYVKDLAGRYMLMNAATRSARGIADDAEVIGKTAGDLLRPEVAARSDIEDQAVVSTGVPVVNREDRITLPSGEDRWYLTTKVPLRDAGGNIAGLIGINRDVTEIRKASEAVQQLNAELEMRVAERTRQLELANRELESFAYSVSHDLRAPLRSIDGFSKALLEDYERQLDADGRDYLSRVRNATRRMATLIDDLLALSRFSRLEMLSEQVDLGALSGEIVEDILKQEPQRSLDVSIGPDLAARGDPSLLRVVMQNLLQNAVKFTCKTRNARIEVGMTMRSGRPEFHVRDNGVGFDMIYVGRLFGAFQRLHADAEFPGTGIGLATVQRIIHRHGGTVRAEAAVGKGTTIFFTLESPRDTP
jgi:PAS domain S-box-containing protein